MENDLKRIQQAIQGQIRNACNNLLKDVTAGLIPLQEHATKLRDYEQRAKQPLDQFCNEDRPQALSVWYEELKIQHDLNLSICESLRKQNDRLQAEIKESYAKLQQNKTESKMQVFKLKDGVSRKDWVVLDPKTKKIIEENPEIQAVLEDQTVAYNKMKRAHGTLVGRLKECQEIIKQMRSDSTTTKEVGNDEQARLSRLKDIIGATTSRSTSPQLPAVRAQSISHGRSGSKILGKIVKSKIPEFSEQSESLELSSDDSVVVLSSDLPETHSDMLPPSIPPSNPLSGAQCSSKRHVDDSQPIFISERPAHSGKKRKINQPPEGTTRFIKSEPSTTDFDFSNVDTASIDLDVTHTPINCLRRRTGVLARSSSDGLQFLKSRNSGRHSEPTMRTMSTGSESTSCQNNQIVFIKNEETLQEPRASLENSRDEVPKSRQLQIEAALQRRPLVPKTPNLKISKEDNTKQIAIAVGEAPKEKDTEFEIVEEPRNATSTPLASTARQSSSPRNLPTKTMAPATQKTFRRKSLELKCSTSINKKRKTHNKRLRDKDANELTLNDFKLNPAMNQGFNDATGRHNSYGSRRNCPAECSKPECCGNAFLAAVRNAGMDSLADLQQEQKDELIESFLGFPLAEIQPLSNQGYQKLLGEAIGKQFAQKYGKEKASRADSPPGFWRVDFPTTQERAADREQAEDLEKAMIVDRRREASKGDGLWLFRDE